MARVLWMGDAGCHSGFAKVTHAIGERLVRDYGHEIHVMANNYRGDSFPSVLDPTQQTPLRLYLNTKLNSKDTYGMTRVQEILGQLSEADERDLDCVVMLNDAQVILQLLFDNPFDRERILLQLRPIISYVPVDGTNLPPLWAEMVPKVTNMVAMSRWGQSLFPDSKLVYHGVDTDRFWPVREKPITMSNGTVCRTKKDCKRAIGLDPDAFVVGRVDKNSGRKDYGALLRVIGPFMRRHKDVQTWLHCSGNEPGHGINIAQTFSRWLSGDEIKARVFQPGLNDSYIGWPEQDMNAVYNAFDLTVSTTRGEGFGLGLAESLAAGVPVVAQNVSAIPEVVGPGGVLVEPSGVMVTVPSGEDLWMPDIAAFSEAVEHLYEAGGSRRRMGEAGLKHVRESFSWDVAAKSFHEYISAFVAA